jgi:hypothetical protein
MSIDWNELSKVLESEECKEFVLALGPEEAEQFLHGVFHEVEKK